MSKPTRGKKNCACSEETYSQVLQQLSDRYASVRARALETLVKLKHPYSCRKVLDALSDKSAVVRATAAGYLGELNCKESIVPLISKLDDRNSEVRMRAAESLGDLLVGGEPPKALIRRLADSDELVKASVAESLGSIGSSKALPALWKAIRDSSPIVRSYVAEAIGNLGTKDDASKLNKQLQQETSEIAKVGFYQALYILEEQSALEFLLSLLRSEDYRVRCAVANVLAQIHADKFNRPLILRFLREALKQEKTIAARSSLRSSIRSLLR